MNYQDDKLLSQRAKNICKFIWASDSVPTFERIVASGVDGSRGSIRLALCELIDVGYVRVVRMFDKGSNRFQVHYEPVNMCDDPTQPEFWT